MATFANHWKRGRHPPTEDGESLPDLQIRVSGSRRRLTELSKVAESLDAQQFQKDHPESLSQLHRSTRLSRVAEFLGTLESSVLDQIAEQADIRVSTFDQSSRAMTVNANPSDKQVMQGPTDNGTASKREKDSVDEHRPFERGIGRRLQSLLAADSKNAAEQKADDEQSSSFDQQTNLTAMLEQLDRDRREQPVAAAIVVTDASHNSIAAVNPRIAAAALKGTPVYVVPIGNTQYVRDVLIQSVFTPTVAMRNDDIVVEAVVQAHDCEGDNCVVQLLQNDEVLDTRTIPLDSGYVTRRVRFDRKLSEVGLQQFAVRILPVDRELSELNNQHDFEVNVTCSEIKILLADEMPRWEYRYLAQLFRRDPKVELDEMLFHPRLIATGRRQQLKAFPTTADEWDQYDVAMLGDVTTEHLPVESQNALITYLRERGGTVIIIAGKESMPQAFADLPLAGVLPVTRLDDNAASMSGRGAFIFRHGRWMY